MEGEQTLTMLEKADKKFAEKLEEWKITELTYLKNKELREVDAHNRVMKRLEERKKSIIESKMIKGD